MPCVPRICLTLIDHRVTLINDPVSAHFFGESSQGGIVSVTPLLASAAIVVLFKSLMVVGHLSMALATFPIIIRMSFNAIALIHHNTTFELSFKELNGRNA